MNTKIAAFIIAILSIFAIYLTIKTFKRDKLSTQLFLMWLFLWSAIGLFALFPSLLDSLMKFVKMGNRLFFLTTAAILILYVIIFYVSSTLSRMKIALSKLVQEISILNSKLEEKTQAENR